MDNDACMSAEDKNLGFLGLESSEKIKLKVYMIKGVMVS